MNQNHPSPEERGPFAGGDADPQRLAKIEQRLKYAQPRPPELDVEAIMRAAQQSVVLPQRPVGQRDRRSYGRIATIAGAWACGAIAGALLTFILLSQSASPETSTDETTAQNEQPPKVTEPGREDAPDGDVQQARSDDLPPKHEPPWTPAESEISVALLDPYIHWTAPYGDGRPTLRAGAMARGRGASGDSRFSYWTDTFPQDVADMPDAGGDAPYGVAPGFDPDLPITREQLLQELLGTRPDSVL